MPDSRSSVGWRAYSVSRERGLHLPPERDQRRRRRPARPSGRPRPPAPRRRSRRRTRRPPRAGRGRSSTGTPRASTYDGTLRNVTCSTAPPTVATRAATRPDGTSIATSVSPSAGAATSPDSTAHVPSAIVPCPHAVENPSLCQNSTPSRAPASSGGDEEAPVHVGVAARLVAQHPPHAVDVLGRLRGARAARGPSRRGCPARRPRRCETARRRCGSRRSGPRARKPQPTRTPARPLIAAITTPQTARLARRTTGSASLSRAVSFLLDLRLLLLPLRGE